MTPPPPDLDSAIRWTIRPKRTLLLVARTATNLHWLIDLAASVLDDRRVQVFCAVEDPGSQFNDGLARRVDELALLRLPWSSAITRHFDLALAASPHGAITTLNAPLLVVPHGSGYARITAQPHLTTRLPVGRNRSVVALVGHDDERFFPAPWETRVVGDTCYDELSTGLRDRAQYRTAFGLEDDQKLIVISSTWGPESVLARRPDLADELVTTLPVDTYRIAVVLHPNVWIGHGEWQVRLWFRRAVEAGVELIPHADGWRAAVVASDLVIGDHGSVTYYAAVLGVPILIGAFGETELDPDSPLTRLAREAPRLTAPYASCIAVNSGHLDRDRFGSLRTAVIAHPGHALERIRATVYEMLRLSEPVSPITVPRPAIFQSSFELAHAFRFESACNTDDDEVHVHVERFPAIVVHSAPVRGSSIVADANHAPAVLCEQAAVLTVDVREMDTAGAQRALAAVLARFPLCRTACGSKSSRTLSVLLASGDAYIVTSANDLPPGADQPVGCLIHALTEAGLLRASTTAILHWAGTARLLRIRGARAREL